MEPASPYRPRVSRETRLLLTAGLLAIAALWLLARVRFPEAPRTPIPAVLGQLATGPRLDDLATEIAELGTRLGTSLIALDASPAPPGAGQRSLRAVALRFRGELAVTWLPAGAGADGRTLVVWDPASGLAVVRVPGAQAPTLAAAPFAPRRPERPRYLIASDPSRSGVSLRPVFVGSLEPVVSALWPQALWTVPAGSDLTPGAFLFTSSGDFVGLVMPHGAERAIVPGATLLAEADRLLVRPKAPAGVIGVEVQALTPPIASVTGAAGGMVVAWVDPAGAAAGRLRVGDVIDAMDGRPLTADGWHARMARLLAGQTLALRVRSRGQVRDVALAAVAAPVPPVSRSLGLTLRRRPRLGAEVVGLEPASEAERAGLRAGDLITLIAEIQAPTPAEVARSFAALAEGQRVMVAVTRGSTHFVTTFER